MIPTRLHAARPGRQFRPFVAAPVRRRPAPAAARRLLALAALAAVATRLPAQRQFEALGGGPLGGGGTAVAMGDVDGDGDRDLVFTQGWQPPQLRLLLNDGRGEFTDVSAAQMPSTQLAFATALELVDVDGDQDLDLVAARFGSNALYLNDGTGVFVDASGNQFAPYTISTAVVAGDVDQDGDVDLVFGNVSYQAGDHNRLYLNDGSGSFVDATAQLPAEFDQTQDMALADVDGDGDLDLVCVSTISAFQCSGIQAAPNRIYTNDGAGVFTAVAWPQQATERASNAVALADVDGDGDLDLAVGNAPTSNCYGAFPITSGGIQLFENTGGGAFVEVTQSQLPAVSGWVEAMEFGDIDGDGDLDLLWTEPGQPGQAGLHLYLNTGSGAFVDVSGRMPNAGGLVLGWSNGLVLGDVDRDGDLDVAVAKGDATQDDVVLRNLLRQLDAPVAPTIGQSYTLDVYARYGVPHLFDVALPYVSTAAGPALPSPLGTIAIDLAQAVPLPPTLVPQPAGVQSVAVAIPNNAALVGLELHAQAVLVPYPLAPRLSNATFGVVQ